jgi:hypothetical protein
MLQQLAGAYASVFTKPLPALHTSRTVRSANDKEVRTEAGVGTKTVEKAGVVRTRAEAVAVQASDKFARKLFFLGCVWLPTLDPALRDPTAWTALVALAAELADFLVSCER